MSSAMITPVLEALRELSLLDAAQLREAEYLHEQLGTPAALTAELVRRGWLTRLQKDYLLEGRARDLVLGPYLLLERLGKGGMGEVFKARHLILNRVVALKVARKDGSKDPSDERRFLREIQATAQLAHPNIVTAYDALRVDGAHVFAMEYVEGTDLGRVLRAYGSLPIAHACDYVRQAALGLQHASEKGLVHRDLKPANLLLTADGAQVKISDLGLVRLGGAEEGQLTSPGLVLGTPDYLAPEQVTNSRSVDIRADLYSLGCTLYHFLAGRPPFVEGTALEKLFKQVEEQPPGVETLRTDVPPGVAAVVRRLLAKKPDDRYQTPVELARALEPFCSPLGPLPAPAHPDPDFLDVIAQFSSSANHPTVRACPHGVEGGSTPADGAPRPVAEAAPAPGDAPAEAAPAAGEGKETGAYSPPPDDPLPAAAKPAPEAAPPAPAPAPAPTPEPAPEPRRRWPSRRAVLVATGVLLVLGVTGRLVRSWVAGGAPAHRQVTNGIGMELTWVPAGEFTRGSPPDEPGRRDDEGPARPVTIGQPFYVAVHETTVAQFRAFAQLTRFRTEAETNGAGAQRWDAAKGAWVQDRACTWRNPGWTPDDDEPVVCVSRFDALAFCYWLGKQEGRVYRLPTEAEWEYACRAGTAGPRAPGEAGPSTAGRPAHVRSIPANAWGLYDLHGNVWQWCADYYSPTYYRDGPARDPQNQQLADLGVLRGGSWQSGPDDRRCAARLGVPLAARRTDTGFRVVLEAGVR